MHHHRLSLTPGRFLLVEDGGVSAMSQSSPCLWTRIPQTSRAPCDRYKHACCSHDGSVYVLGGRGSGGLGDFWRYSIVCNEWTELNCSSEAAPEELEEHSMVAHEGLLYVFGGLLDSAYTRWTCPLWLFDVAKQKWVPPIQGKTIPPPQSRAPTNRKGHSGVVLGAAMLLYGGFVDMKGSSHDFWRLDFDSRTWSLLSGSQQDSWGPGPRHSHVAVVHQSCMYLFGGLKGLREQRDLWSWSSCSDTWTSVRTKSGPPRLVGHSAVVYKDSMLIFGGGESQNSPKNRLWRFNLSTQTWNQLATLPGSTPPDKIHHCCAGLGPSYRSSSSSLGGGGSGSGLQPRLLGGRLRPFKNKCFPAPLTFLGSEVSIELETFGPDRRYGSRTPSQQAPGGGASTGADAPRVGSCLTFENQAFRTQWSCTEEEEEEQDVAQHLPDLLLVLGGRPCSRLSPMSVWQMTLTDS